MDKEIQIKYKGSHSFKLKDLYILQNKKGFCFKELSKEGFQKLATSLIDNGFWFPFFFWHCKKDKKNYYLDGTQRDKVLLELQRNGYIDNKGKHWNVKLPDKFPATEIFADNKKEAHKAILTQSSNYGKISNESLYEFIETNELNFNDLKLELDLPEINLDDFQANFYDDVEINESENNELEAKNKCPKCGYEW